MTLAPSQGPSASTSPQWVRNAFENHPEKNRFPDVYCLDKNRVEVGGAYIHANEIKLPGDSTRYVMTQAPIRSTVVDFWRMVWQMKPMVIAALCQPFRDEERCLPTIGREWKRGKFEIKRAVELDANEWWSTVECAISLTESEDEDEDVAIESFDLRYLMWYEWLRDEDPPTPDRMLAFVQELHIQIDHVEQKSCRGDDAKTDVLLVCPTGAVRSGLVTAASSLARAITDNTYTEFQIDDVVKNLRSVRHRTIDRFSQYAYLHWFVCEAACEAPEESISEETRKKREDAVERARCAYVKASREEKLASI